MPQFFHGDVSLFYTVSGDEERDWLLLIPGFASDTTTWALMLPHFLPTYRVLRVDNRGLGQRSSPDTPFSITDMAQDIAALLVHLGIAQIHVAGHSMGGQIAQELALLVPNAVKTLSLISTWARPDAKLQALIECLGILPQHLAMDIYLKSLVHWSFSERFFATPQALEQIDQAIAANPHPPTAPVLLRQSQAIVHSDTSSRLSQIQCPTLIIHGDQDILTPLHFAHELAAGIPQAQCVVLEETAHGCVIEAATEVAQAMLSFLASQSQTAPA